MIPPAKSMQYTNMSASGCVFSGAGRLAGIIISSSTSGTLKAWDNTSGSGTVIFNTTAAITAPITINAFNLGFKNGLFITIGGTIDICVVWHPE